MSKKYHKGNFFKHTYCTFQQVREVDFPFQIQQPHYKSKSGSSYFYTESGVYRVANHWGRAANCRWRIVSLEEEKKARFKIGYATWTSFYSDNDSEKLYVIKISDDGVTFQHKDEFFSEDKIKRTASETAKIIRKIKALQQRKNDYISQEKLNQEIKKLIFI